MKKYLAILLVFFSCKDNIERTYHPNGQLFTIGERINGKLEGDLIQFDENGDTAFVTPYLNGLRHGKERQYENNKVTSIWSYELDTGHGEYLNFYQSGALMSRGLKEKGYHVGEWVSYFKTGELRSKSKMKNEWPITQTGYYKNGQIQYYVDNYSNGIYLYYDSLGNKLLEATIIERQLRDTLFCDPKMPKLQ
ncbi:toxin-antitoxin system YwqK family antitoxin [Reichenbachiella sp.]